MSDSFLDKYVKQSGTQARSHNGHGELLTSDPVESAIEAGSTGSGGVISGLAAHDSDSVTDLGCFGWYRGVRERALMLELRKKDGHIMAVGYAWIERMEFDPSQGITLYAPGNRIRITGSGLNVDVRPSTRLFDGLIRHRVPWIQECDRNESLHSSGNAAIIERISWDG